MDKRTQLAEVIAEQKRRKDAEVVLPMICFVGRDTQDGPWMCQHTRWGKNGLEDDGQRHEHSACERRHSSGLAND